MPIVIWFLAGGAAVAAAIWFVRKRTHAAQIRRREAVATAAWLPVASPIRPLHAHRSAPRAVTGDLARAREKETTQHMLS